MKVAVACDGSNVSSRGAQCESFMCYSVDKGIVTSCQNLPNMSMCSEDAIEVMREADFDVLIAEDIDVDAASALCDAGIEVVAGVQGGVREVLESYINQTLMGAVELCRANSEDNDPEDQDVDEAFEKMALSLGL